MEDNDLEKDGTSKERPLQIDPKWCVRQTPCVACVADYRVISFQDALRAFFQPLKTDDPRLNFYTIYKREATEYDMDYVKKYDEDLNTTLIFVRRLL
jgi:hypothetical protein